MPRFRGSRTRMNLSEAYRVLAPLRQHKSLSAETRALVAKLLVALDRELSLRPLDAEPTEPGVVLSDFIDHDPTKSDR